MTDLASAIAGIGADWLPADAENTEWDFARGYAQAKVDILSALTSHGAIPTPRTTLTSSPQGGFSVGDRVRKIKGSSWQGIVVGHYSTTLTPEGYCVESEREPGSVQIYPASALELVVE